MMKLNSSYRLYLRIKLLSHILLLIYDIYFLKLRELFRSFIKMKLDDANILLLLKVSNRPVLLL